MAYLLMPLANLYKTHGLFFWDPDGGLPTLLMFILLPAIILWRKNLSKMTINPIVGAFIGLVIIQQGYATLVSKNTFTNLTNFNTSFMSVFIWIAIASLTYIFIQQIVQTEEDQLRFIKGIVIALLINYVVGGLQFLWILTGQFDGLVRFIGQVFEARIHPTYQFNKAGSYVQTVKRINGLTIEASHYAVQVAILTYPLVLSGIITKFNLFKSLSTRVNQIVYHSLFFITLGFLIVCKSSTGLVLGGGASGLLFLIYARRYGKKLITWSLVAGIVMAGLICLIYYTSDTANEFLKTYIFKKNLTTRWAITAGFFKSFMESPIIGHGYPNKLAVILAPKDTIHDNYEYYYMFMDHVEPALLSILGYLLAKYGLIIWGPMLAYFGSLLRRMRREFSNRIAASDNLMKFNYYMFSFYLVFMAVSLFFSFQYKKEQYIWLLFYFIVIIPRKKASNTLQLKSA